MVSDSNPSLNKELGDHWQVDEEAQTQSPNLNLDANKELDSDSQLGTDVEGDGVQTPPVAVGWESDPENAQNWPVPKKIFHTAIPAFYGFVV
jgi:hypothetical protein